MTDHGGLIRCESQVGVGTLFRMVWPIAEVKPDMASVVEEGQDDYTGHT